MRDFVAVAPAFSYDAVMVVHPSVPAKTVKEFIALAKSQARRAHLCLVRTRLEQASWAASCSS